LLFGWQEQRRTRPALLLLISFSAFPAVLQIVLRGFAAAFFAVFFTGIVVFFSGY